MKRRRKHPSPPPPIPWDTGALGPANQARLVVEERGHIDHATGKRINPNNVRGVRRQSWVEVYHKQGKLTREQAGAAVQLRDAAEGRLHQDPLAALRIDPPSEAHDPAAALFDARRAFHRMWHVIPPFARRVVEHVVINDCAVSDRAGSPGIRERQMERLRKGLQALADAFATPAR